MARNSVVVFSLCFVAIVGLVSAAADPAVPAAGGTTAPANATVAGGNGAAAAGAVPGGAEDDVIGNDGDDAAAPGADVVVAGPVGSEHEGSFAPGPARSSAVSMKASALAGASVAAIVVGFFF